MSKVGEYLVITPCQEEDLIGFGRPFDTPPRALKTTHDDVVRGFEGVFDKGA